QNQMYSSTGEKMELSVAIQAKVEVTPSNWNFGFQPTLDLNKKTISLTLKPEIDILLAMGVS
ncbi:hypothetical protein ACTQ5A_09995, partial [Bacillota bacterium LCP21S3_F9]